MLTASDAFKIKMSQAGVQPVYIVELHLSSVDIRYYSTSPIPAELTGLAGVLIDASLSDVAGVSSSIDIVSRAVSIGEVHLVFVDDGVARKLIKENFVFGKKVVIKLGTADMTDYADFLPVTVAVTREVIPSEGEVTIECVDMLDLLTGRELGPRYWLNGHPLEIIEDILIAVGIDASYYDASTLSPTADLTRSHFLVSRYDAKTRGLDERISSNGVNDDGVKALALIEELSDLLWGSFYPDETGLFKFKTYDPATAVTRSLGDGDVGEIAQTSTADPLYNKVTMQLQRISRIYGGTAEFSFFHNRRSRGEVNIGFSQTDTISADNYNFLGNTSGERELKIGTNWVTGPSRICGGWKMVSGVLTDEIDISSSTRGGMGTNGKRASILSDHDAMVIGDGAYNGFSGCTFNLGTIAASSRTGRQIGFPHTFPVKSSRSVTSDRPAYLLIEGLAEEYVFYAKVKTYAGLAATEIEVEDVHVGNGFGGSTVRFGNDNRTDPKTPNGPGYRLVSYNPSTGILTIAQGLIWEALPGTMVIDQGHNAQNRGINAINMKKEQFRTEIVKCVEAEAHSQIGELGETYYAGQHLKYFPGADGCLGPWDTRTQRMEKSRDIARTCIGATPTASVEGEEYIWPYLTLYNHRYPKFVRYRFEGTSGAFGTDVATGHSGLGTPASGRGQFGTKTPYRWSFISPEIATTRNGQEESVDGLYWARVWDITILVDNVNRRLQRFKNGCSKLTLKTSLVHADLQLGDFVTLSTDLYTAYGSDGTDHGEVFEIISKTVDALSDMPGCTFEIAWARSNVTPVPASSYSYNSFNAQRGQQTATNNNVYSVVGGAVEPVTTNAGIEVSSSTHRSL